MDKQQGVLVGIQMFTGLAAMAFIAAAILAVDSAGKFYPLHGFLQNLGLAFVSVAFGFLGGYLQMKRVGFNIMPVLVCASER